MRRTTWVWGSAALLYAIFWTWYTPLGGPLSPEEIDRYVATLEHRADAPDPDRLTAIRRFLEADTGRDFLMLNAIRLREPPLAAAGAEGAARGSARAVLERYMAFVLPQLLRRAGHPVAAGPAAGPAVEHWGIEGAQDWSMGALVRYRSRRDLMEMVTDPGFAAAHEFKWAAIEKTFAYPIDPYVHVPGVRASVALGFVAVACFVQLVLTRAGRSTGRPR